jgi:hypothetical protein
MVSVAVVLGDTEVLVPVSVAGDAEQGCVVVLGGGTVVDVEVVVVVGFFLFGATAADFEVVWADTATLVPNRTPPTTMAPRPKAPSRRAMKLDRPTASPCSFISARS